MVASPLLFVLAFLFSLSVHEAAHALMSDRLGDPTARLSGRATLNPLAHLDPIGTLLPLFFILTGSPIVFGWGKPVPIDPFNLRHPKKDSAIISLAGPLSNLLLAVILSVVIRLSHFIFGSAGFTIEFMLSPIVALNVMWACFNLIPVHPLDGGKVLIGFLPSPLAQQWDDILSQYGFLILLFLIIPFAGISPVTAILSPVVNLILAILLPSTPII